MTAERAAPADHRIVALDTAGYEAAIPALAALVVDVVAGGASVNFLAGVTDEEATRWWSARIPDVADGTITAFVAIDEREARQDDGPGSGAKPDKRREPSARIVGSAILIRSRNANAFHRAEVGKVLVHRSARRRGIARDLMTAVEDRARRDGRWLLILTTEAGSAADALYRSLGWIELGTMPDNAHRADGTLVAATWFWKDLRRPGGT